jgi:hypothetical protein
MFGDCIHEGVSPRHEPKMRISDAMIRLIYVVGNGAALTEQRLPSKHQDKHTAAFLQPGSPLPCAQLIRLDTVPLS